MFDTFFFQFRMRETLRNSATAHAILSEILTDILFRQSGHDLILIMD